jgi:hypothetical protein
MHSIMAAADFLFLCFDLPASKQASKHRTNSNLSEIVNRDANFKNGCQVTSSALITCACRSMLFFSSFKTLATASN